MKHVTAVLFSALLLLAAAAPAAAAAPSDDNTFYVGLDGRIDVLSWKNSVDTSYPQAVMGLGLRGGYRLSPYFSVELGYSISADEHREMDINADRWRYRLTLREVQADVYGFLPLGQSGRFRPFVSLGVAYADGNARIRREIDGTDSSGDATTTVTYTPLFSKGEIDYRAGAGIELHISDTVDGRIYARYQSYSFNAINGGITLGFTVNVAVN
jgi:opacity protein-like surface antigen